MSRRPLARHALIGAAVVVHTAGTLLVAGAWTTHTKSGPAAGGDPFNPFAGIGRELPALAIFAVLAACSELPYIWLARRRRRLAFTLLAVAIVAWAAATDAAVGAPVHLTGPGLAGVALLTLVAGSTVAGLLASTTHPLTSGEPR